MQEYLSRVKRLSTTDSLNSEVINSVVQDLQHNIDVLYNSISLSNNNWNVSELVFGNLLDVNSTGEKVFTNGGRFDSVEKVLSFTPSVGSVSYENNTELIENGSNEVEGEHFLRWDVPQGITDNVVLTRNIAIPEQLRHQNILLGFKLCGFVFNQALENESFEIYVNGAFVGTGETGIEIIDGLYKMKTIYGSYSLSGSERNLEVKVVRTSTQTQTTSEYRIRIQDAFIGLNTLALEQYFLNFPPNSTMGTDISNFYDFDNNSIIPVPKVWTEFNFPTGNSTLNVTVNQQPLELQDEYFIANDATGNGLGTTTDNKMSAVDFFAIESFPASIIRVHLDCSNDYGDFTFNRGATYVLDMSCGDVFCNNFIVDKGSTVELNVDLPDALSEILFKCESITVNNNSRLSSDIIDSSNRLEFTCNGDIIIDGNSTLDISTGMFNMPLDQDIIVKLNDNSHFALTLKDSSFQNPDASNGMGCIVAPINANKYSYVELASSNSLLSCHIANSSKQDKPVLLKNHSQLIVSGFDKLNTFTKDRTFYAFLHSSIEVSCDVEFDTGDHCDTSFTKIELALFSSFGAKPSNTDHTLSWANTIDQELIESFVYEID